MFWIIFVVLPPVPHEVPICHAAGHYGWHFYFWSMEAGLNMAVSVKRPESLVDAYLMDFKR
jgi:uncharacterized membrane protein YjjB (DUF3815 family)